MTSIAAVSTAAVVALTVACADGDDSPPEWSGRLDTLATGVIIAENAAAGVWRQPDRWTLAEELRIGSAEGDGPAVFAGITALGVDRAGRIHVLDNRADNVRVFAPDGRYLRTLGRSGAGPGSHSPPSWASWHTRLDAILRLLTYDFYIRPDRGSTFDHGMGWGAMETELMRRPLVATRPLGGSPTTRA
jgi:hypothetical protein